MWYVAKDVRLYDKAVRDRANHTWTDGSLQEKAAQRTIENSLDFCHELRESDDEDSDEHPEFICANGGRSRTKTEENQGEARIIVNAIAKCPPVWDNLILERGNDNGCACPCAKMLGEWMEAQGVDIKKCTCSNTLHNPQELLQHLRDTRGIYHKAAYYMLKQMMTGFHAPTVDHYGIDGARAGERTPGHITKRNDATRHCFECRVEETITSPLEQRPFICRHSYCRTCWSNFLPSLTPR